MNLIVVFLSTILTIGFIAWYMPYYNERLIQHEKHDFVLNAECWEGKFHPKVQHNKMTYDGLATNCSEAAVFTSVPVWLGAINNMWEGSVFYTLLHATNWQLQVTYVTFGLVISVVTILELSKYIKWRSITRVLTSNNNNGKPEFVDPLTGRKRVLMVSDPIKQNPFQHNNSNEEMKNIANSILQKGGLMPKNKNAISTHD